MFIRKLTKALFGFCLLLCLSACSDRAEFEKRFAKVGEVYPTENVSDLFKKFPDGFVINQTRFEYGGNKTHYHYIRFQAKPDSKQLLGNYRKSYYNNKGEEVTVISYPVEYTSSGKLIAVNGEAIDPFMTDFQFAFEWLTINSERLSQLDFNTISENPVSKDYGIYYRIVDSKINKILGIAPNIKKLDLNLKGDFSMDRDDKFASTIHISEIRETDSTQYLWEQVYERNRNEE